MFDFHFITVQCDNNIYLKPTNCTYLSNHLKYTKSMSWFFPQDFGGCQVTWNEWVSIVLLRYLLWVLSLYLVGSVVLTWSKSILCSCFSCSVIRYPFLWCSCMYSDSQQFIKKTKMGFMHKKKHKNALLWNETHRSTKTLFLGGGSVFRRFSLIAEGRGGWKLTPAKSEEWPYYETCVVLFFHRKSVALQQDTINEDDKIIGRNIFLT